MAKVNASRLVFTAFVMVVMISFVYAWFTFSSQEPPLPSIQGKVLSKAKPLKYFQLQSANNRIFNKESLTGHWSIISYGYRHCPDICPTTLMTLSALLTLLDENHQQGQLNAMFYSVDAKRDSIEVLTQYSQYFSQEIIPLRAENKSNATSFEQQLGIQVQFNENKAKNSYDVAHSVSMLLINPNAALQAVFLPKVSDLGIEHFEEQQLLNDFLSVKGYFDAKQQTTKSLQL